MTDWLFSVVTSVGAGLTAYTILRVKSAHDRARRRRQRAAEWSGSERDTR